MTTLTSIFGKHYRIHRIEDGSVPKGLIPERFSDRESTCSFLRALEVREGYWRKLLFDVSGQSSVSGDTQVIHRLAEQLFRGKFRVYEVVVSNVAQMYAQNLKFSSASGEDVFFAQASSFVGESLAGAVGFVDYLQAKNFITSVASNEDQLKTLLSVLKIENNDTRYRNLEPSEFLAKEVMSGKIIITKMKKRLPTAPSAAPEAVQDAPGTRPVELAPESAPASQAPGPEAPGSEASAPEPVDTQAAEADQAQALQEASEEGTPFCEECAEEAEVAEAAQAQSPPPPAAAQESGSDTGGEAAAASVPPVVQDEVAEEVPNCEFTEFSMQCSHVKTRSYKLDVINDAPNFNSQHKVLRVISQPGDEDEITVKYAGSCGKGNTQCPSLEVSGGESPKTVTTNPFKFKVVPPDNSRSVNSFTDFLKYMLLPTVPSLDYKTYQLKNCGCSEVDSHVAEVHAFPTWKWEGKAAFGYNTTTEDDEDKRKEQNLGEKREWKLEIGIAGNISTNKYEFKNSNKYDNQSYFKSIIDPIRGFIDKLEEISDVHAKNALKHKADEDKLVKFKMGWPNVALSGAVELKEFPEATDIGFGGEVVLSMAPLISAEVRTDILEWLLLAVGPPHGKLLLEVKRKAAKGVGSKTLNVKAVAAVDIVIKGSIDAALKWAKGPHEKWLSTEGDKVSEVKAGLTIGVEAVLKAEATVFRMKVTTGLEMHLKGATNADEGIGIVSTIFATTEDNKPAIGGQVKFTGVAVYYTYYADLGVSERASDAADASNRQGSGRFGSMRQQGSGEGTGKAQQMEKLCTFFNPFELPEYGPRAGVPVDEISL